MSSGWTEHAALIAAVRHGLEPGATPITLDASEGSVVLDRARFDHVTGFLAAAVADGVVAIPDPQLRGELERRWRQELQTCVVLEALAVRVADVLTGLEWRLTKGAALAHLDYPDPTLRTFGDVDVLIHPDDWEGAVDRLIRAGYRRTSRELHSRFDARWGKGATFVDDQGLELDVHRRFAIGRFGVSADMREVFAPADEVRLADRTIHVLSPEHRLLHACYHASLGGFRRLRAFRDVAQLVLVSNADWQRTFAVARSWRAEAVVASAITETWQRLQLDADHPARDAATATAVSDADRRALRHFTERSTFRRQSLTAIARLPPTDVPRYVWSLASHRLPSWIRR